MENGNNNNDKKNKPLPDETKAKISEKLKGRKFSDEHKAKIAEANRQRGGLSEETKEKIRLSKLGKKTGLPAHNRKPVVIVDGVECKECPTCKATKPLTKYYNNKRNADGLTNKCKVCHKKSRVDYYHNNEQYRRNSITKRVEEARETKKKAIEYKGGFCLKCGLKHEAYDNEHAFDFHHRDPNEKDFAIGEYKSWAFERLKPELDKCDLLCAICHRKIHQYDWRNNGR
jgi:hypothetical protein